MHWRHRPLDVIKQAETERWEDAVHLSRHLLSARQNRQLWTSCQRLSRRSSSCSHLPRCYHRSGTYIRWSHHTVTGRCCFHCLRQLRSIRRLPTTDTCITSLSPLQPAKISVIVSLWLFVCLCVCLFAETQKMLLHFCSLIELGDFWGHDRPIGCPQNVGNYYVFDLARKSIKIAPRYFIDSECFLWSVFIMV